MRLRRRIAAALLAAAQGCAPHEHNHGGGLGCHSTPPHSCQHFVTGQDGNGHYNDCHPESSPPHQ